MVTHHTPRAYERFRVRCWLTLDVNQRKVRVRAIEMSAAGAAVMSLSPVAVGANVMVRSHIELLAGNAEVRYCKKRGLAYRIGLQFSRPLAARF